MLITGINYWLRRAFIDKSWWALSVGGSFLTIALTRLYVEILISPRSGEHLGMDWDTLAENSFVSWSLQLLLTSIAAILIAGRNGQANSKTIEAWLFPNRSQVTIQSVLGIGILNCISSLPCIAVMIAIVSANASANPDIKIIIGLIVSSTLSILLAVAFGVGILFLTQSVAFSLICVIALFWVIPGIFAVAQISAAWLPASGLLSVAWIPLKNPNFEQIFGMLWPLFLVLAAMVRTSRSDII